MIDFLARSQTEANSGCWLWEGAVCEKGYGRVAVQRKNRRAHRISWMQQNGPIPDGMLVCHRCDTRCCVNPDHLWIGSDTDNNHDMLSKGREKWMHGITSPHAKLCDEDVIYIRSSKESKHKLAKKFGVSPSTIGCAREYVTWKHIP